MRGIEVDAVIHPHPFVKMRGIGRGLKTPVKGTEVSKSKSATRNRLPAPEVKARGRAAEIERKGKLSPAQAARIRAKANRLLGE